MGDDPGRDHHPPREADDSMTHEPPGRQARLEALRRDLRADLTANPDERVAIPTRGYEWSAGLKPQNLFTAWLVDQASVIGLRMERLQRIERRKRLRRSIRAAFFWDDDRRIEVEHLGANLAIDPPAVKFGLEQTPQGCDWLLLRWSHLEQMARKPTGWDDRDRQLALNLIGTAPDLRPLDPAAALGDPLPLIAREVARLEAIKLGVVGDIDAFDRCNAEADLVEDKSAEALQIRREITSLHHRLRWYYAEIKHPINAPRPSTDFLERCFPLPQQADLPGPTIEAPRPGPRPVVELPPPPEPEPAPQPEPEPEPEPEEEITLAPPVPKPPPSRRQRRAKIAQTRQAGRGPDLCQT